MTSEFRKIVYAGLFGVAMYFGGKAILENIDWERTRKEVVRTIDKNKDGVADSTEWAPVYRGLGIKFQRNYGLDLEISDFEKYLKNHRGKE